jgi:predicted DNA-binding ribbon-helix-helix protein
MRPSVHGLFAKVDPIQYEQRTRTVRVHGVATRIRLENMVWDILADMAEAEGRATNGLIALFYDEILLQRGEVQNFASFLRVTCVCHLRLRLMARHTVKQPSEATQVSVPDRASTVLAWSGPSPPQSPKQRPKLPPN